MIIIPLVTAEISINGPGRAVVNVGDELALSGFVTHTTSLIGVLKMRMVCGAIEQPLLIRSISLTANVQEDFEETLPVPLFIEGSCKMRVSVEHAGQIILETESPEFVISKEIVGSFSINAETIKLGDQVIVKGMITKLDGSEVEGIATVFLKQAGTDVLVDTIEVKKGVLEYEMKTIELLSGQYAINVAVQDIFGNEKTFQGLVLTIAGNISVFAEPEQLHVGPGEKVRIIGEATVLDKPLEKGKAKIRLAEEEVEVSVIGGAFSGSIRLPEQIKSGRQEVDVLVEDDFGNRGQVMLAVIVDPLSTRVEVSGLKESYLPGETMTVTPVIEDQAGDVVTSDVGITIVNARKSVAYTDTVQSNTLVDFGLLNDAPPGTWKIELFSSGIKDEVMFTVEEKVLLEYEIINQTLVVTNRGNVQVEGPLKIELQGVDTIGTIVKDMSLGLGKSKEINLASGVKEGVYNVYVGEEVFENVVIAGGKRRDQLIIGVLWFILGVLVLLLVWYVLRWINAGKKKIRRVEEKKVRIHPPEEEVKRFRVRMAEQVDKISPKMQFKVKKQNIKDEFVYDLPAKKQPKSFWELSDEPVYRNDVMKQEKSREKNQKNSGEPKRSLFRMFD